jgi:hypothetical protein
VISTPRVGYAELKALLDQARRPCTPLHPTEALLVGSQVRWNTALSSRLGAVLEYGRPRLLVAAVSQAWQDLAADFDILRRLLDDPQNDSHAFERAQSVELRMLALAAGLSSLGDPEDEAIRVGRAYRTRIQRECISPARVKTRMFRCAKVR